MAGNEQGNDQVDNHQQESFAENTNQNPQKNEGDIGPVAGSGDQGGNPEGDGAFNNEVPPQKTDDNNSTIYVKLFTC